MYKVFLTNHGYYAHEEFKTFEAALAWARAHSFQASIHCGDVQQAYWCPLNGLTDYRRS